MKNTKNTLHYQSGVNQKGEPFVQLIKDGALICQMDPQQARDFANAMMETAEAAEQDAFLFGWCIRKVGSAPREAMTMLQEFRAYRIEQTGKRGGPVEANDWVMPPPQEAQTE